MSSGYGALLGIDEPKLVDSYVTFLDALGSEALLTGTPAAVEARFQRFRRAWARAVELSGAKSLPVASAAFSDNIVVGIPLVGADGEDALRLVIEVAADFQLLLAVEGILCRGGLARGLTWIDDALVFGPGLIDAYNLERRQAHYPRIVLDDEVARAAATYADQYGNRAHSSLGYQIVL